MDPVIGIILVGGLIFYQYKQYEKFKNGKRSIDGIELDEYQWHQIDRLTQFIKSYFFVALMLFSIYVLIVIPERMDLFFIILIIAVVAAMIENIALILLKARLSKKDERLKYNRNNILYLIFQIILLFPYKYNEKHIYYFAFLFVYVISMIVDNIAFYFRDKMDQKEQIED